MKQDQDNLTAADGRRGISRVYREMATERVPQKLDNAVLKEAALAATDRRNGFVSWFRPLAFVATVGLSLAVVLEISRSPDLDAPDSPLLEATDAVSADAVTEKTGLREQNEIKRAPVAGGNRPQKQIPSTEEAATTRQQQRQTGAAERFESGTLTTDALKKEAERGAVTVEKTRSRRADEDARGAALRAVGGAGAASVAGGRAELDDRAAVLESRAQPMDARGNALTDAPAHRQPAAQVAEALTVGIAAAPDRCDEETRAQAGSWWQCIEAFRAGDRADIAARELEEFRDAFPDFQPEN